MEETSRLKALRRYGVLDTLPEQALDDLTLLAATICEAPIALISLVDECRQWFKSKVGLAVTETPRDVSFCAHALHQRDLLIVPDATADARFADNLLVTGEPGIRFYAGAPLVTPEGEVLGTLCVIDRVPRTLTAVQEQALQVLARQVMTQLELRRHTRLLADKERLLSAIFEAEPECVKLLGPDGGLQMMNRAGLEIMEAANFEDVAGQLICPHLVPEDRAPFEDLMKRVFRGESGTLEFRGVGIKGTPRWLETHAAPLRNDAGEITSALSITRDITARRKAEDALRASEARYRTLIESASDGIMVSDAGGRLMDANPASCGMLGYSREELLTMSIAEIIASEEAPRLPAEMARLHAGEVVRSEWTFQRKDGTHFPCEVSGTVLPDGGVLAILRDVTDRKRNEARFRRLVDSNAQGVAFWNAKGELTAANDAFLRTTGYSREDMAAGRVGWATMTPPEYADLDRRASEELAATGACTPFEKQYIRKDGSRVAVLVGAATFEDDPREGVSFVLDLTERKKLEQQFLRAQRMENIGTLAGGIAHDLNNALAPVMMSLEVLRARFPDSESVNLLDVLSGSVQRGADMVRQVLSFARGAQGRRMEVQIRHLVQDMEKTVRDTFLKSVEMRTAIPGNLWTVMGDPTQLHQVLMNLCVNARDAMPGGGVLTISAENLTLDAHYASLNPEAKPGPYVLIQVEDAGSGIPQEILEKIFDPFFTTKEVGKGTGLGLSTSLAIIKSHGGFMRVYSEMGKGTKFHINLPAHGHASHAAAAKSIADMPRGEGELILVVDDESSVRHITEQTLEAFGYRVIVACDGTEAVAIYATRKEEIAAVLTDMTMPVMDGLATIQVLRKINPEVRIIAASGLTANSQLAGLGVKHFLPKPYTADLLLRVLRDVLTT